MFKGYNFSKAWLWKQTLKRKKDERTNIMANGKFPNMMWKGKEKDQNDEKTLIGWKKKINEIPMTKNHSKFNKLLFHWFEISKTLATMPICLVKGFWMLPKS